MFFKRKIQKEADFRVARFGIQKTGVIHWRQLQYFREILLKNTKKDYFLANSAAKQPKNQDFDQKYKI